MPELYAVPPEKVLWKCDIHFNMQSIDIERNVGFIVFLKLVNLNQQWKKTLHII